MFVTYERGRTLTKFIVTWFLCSVAAEPAVVASKASNNDFASAEKLRIKKDVEEFHRILPVQVNFGGFVSIINHRILGMEGNLTDLDEQLRIIEAKDAEWQKETLQLKSRLKTCEEGKAEAEEENARLKEQLEAEREFLKNVSSERNPIKEEISRLKKKIESLGALKPEPEPEPEPEPIESSGEPKLPTTAESIITDQKHVSSYQTHHGIPRSWDEALKKCESKGIDLARHATKKLIKRWAKLKYERENVWIGGRMNAQATEANFKDSFEWVHGGGPIPADDELWEISEPSDISRKCVFFNRKITVTRKDGTQGHALQTAPCADQYDLVCEKYA